LNARCAFHVRAKSSRTNLRFSARALDKRCSSLLRFTRTTRLFTILVGSTRYKLFCTGSVALIVQSEYSSPIQITLRCVTHVTVCQLKYILINLELVRIVLHDQDEYLIVSSQGLPCTPFQSGGLQTIFQVGTTSILKTSKARLLGI